MALLFPDLTSPRPLFEICDGVIACALFFLLYALAATNNKCVPGGGGAQAIHPIFLLNLLINYCAGAPTYRF
jgi:hypothetical protein